MFRICKKIKKTVKCVHDDDDDDSGENYRLVPVIPGYISNILPTHMHYTKIESEKFICVLGVYCGLNNTI